MTWHPIETAPRGGTEVLVCLWAYGDPSQGERHMSVAFWEHDTWTTEQAPLWPPTHWQPLPAPPEAES
jgi:hypothetical protein